MGFKKGSEWTGNPHGRPKKALVPKDVSPPPEDPKKLARDKSPDAVKTLIEIMTSQTSSTAHKLAAANAILDRGYGKPQQMIEAQVSSFDRMSDRELLSFLTGVPIESEIIEGELIEEYEDEGFEDEEPEEA